ncbi:hypothetical protein H6G33_25240 [Calothrix sp. FACHB-1219]|uniref:hypothetical protein n=1 Tax=unclassified Calothrix TaxID=2619626 RepID=UPI001686C287|nr:MULTISPECIES: hypothetical protein [unclassified Calothrix]MBD2206437.1 hypothetical protein [Calothrix sp. FACHB-168]MBD2220314.1 hypothetical protein [Calothrix sp. FACHB-1219]
MTYTTYSHQQLRLKSIARLKQIYCEVGCTVEVLDKRCKDAWMNAIADYQASQVQTAVNAAPDEQTLAQAELDQYIADQAEAIAPQLTTVEINCYHYEVYALKQLVAYIAYDYDEFVTQPWVVMINGEEQFRHQTQAQCYRYIQWHHQDGTLNPQIETEIPEAPTILEISFYDQEAFVGDLLVASISYDHGNYQNLYWRVMINGQEIFRDISPARCHSYIKQQYQQGLLPLQEQLEEEEPWATGNEIMAEIFTACENYGFEMLNDGIYHNDIKLGEVGCTDGRWWVVRAAQENQRIPCNSASEAMQLLSESAADEYLGYRLLEHLSPREWRSLLSGAAQGQKLVTA